MGWFGPDGSCGCCDPCCTEPLIHWTADWTGVVEGVDDSGSIELGEDPNQTCQWTGTVEVCSNLAGYALLGFTVFYADGSWTVYCTIVQYSSGGVFQSQRTYTWADVATGTKTCAITSFVLDAADATINDINTFSSCMSELYDVTIQGFVP